MVRLVYSVIFASRRRSSHVCGGISAIPPASALRGRKGHGRRGYVLGDAVPPPAPPAPRLSGGVLKVWTFVRSAGGGPLPVQTHPPLAEGTARTPVTYAYAPREPWLQASSLAPHEAHGMRRDLPFAATAAAGLSSTDCVVSHPVPRRMLFFRVRSKVLEHH